MDELTLHRLFVTANCAGSGCPATYRTSRGTLAVQGWTMAGDGGISVPDGEGIVEIPADVEDSIGEAWARERGLIA
jgi:hypothetical protein